MSVYWQYEGICQLPDALPTEVKQEWIATLQNEQSRIYNNLLAKIPDILSFQDRIADASSDEFENFLASVGARWDVDVIKMKQRVKLARAYPSWKTGVDNAFGEGGYFADRVSGKADKFELARYVLGVVGYKPSTDTGFGVWNPVVVGVLLMRGDTRPIRYFDANDTLTGTHEAVMDATKGRLISPSIIAHAIYASVMAKFADEGNLTTIRDNVLTNANSVIDEILQVGLDTTHLGDGYDVTYVLSWDDTSSNVKVTVTDTHPS